MTPLAIIIGYLVLLLLCGTGTVVCGQRPAAGIVPPSVATTLNVCPCRWIGC